MLIVLLIEPYRQNKIWNNIRPHSFVSGWTFVCDKKKKKKNQPNSQVALRQDNKGSLGSVPGYNYYWLNMWQILSYIPFLFKATRKLQNNFKNQIQSNCHKIQLSFTASLFQIKHILCFYNKQLSIIFLINRPFFVFFPSDTLSVCIFYRSFFFFC